MNLPTRILAEPPVEPVISVDGAFGAPGLELSHWPGNVTPPELKHDLSTGCALRFARLDGGERARLAGGAVAIVNNHYDTDGVCAVFATRYPELALDLEERLLAAAATGDFYQVPDHAAFAVDAIVSGMADVERSPLRSELAGLDDCARWERAQNVMLDLLPQILPRGNEAERAVHRELWEGPLESLRADVHDLGQAAREDDEARRLTAWTAARGVRSSRRQARAFDPGRHALFGASDAERVLTVGPGEDGTTWRLVLSTRAWFDLVTHRALPRPDLEPLAHRLNELEGTDPASAAAWRAQPLTNAAPELWFGAADVESFAEHSGALRASALDGGLVRAEIRGALA